MKKKTRSCSDRQHIWLDLTLCQVNFKFLTDKNADLKFIRIVFRKVIIIIM